MSSTLCTCVILFVLLITRHDKCHANAEKEGKNSHESPPISMMSMPSLPAPTPSGRGVLQARRELGGQETPPITVVPPSPPSPTPPSPSPKEGCFSENSIVEVQGKGFIPISQLQLGDMVRTQGGFTEVYAFANFDDSSTQRQFVELVTASSNKIEVTPHHMLYLYNQSNPLPARNIQVGDMLVLPSLPNKYDRVVKKNIFSLDGKGIYSPLTVDGMIEVNGVLASNYATFGSAKIFAYPELYHWVLAPLRISCSYLSKSICRSTLFYSEGKHLYLSVGARLGRIFFAPNSIDD